MALDITAEVEHATWVPPASLRGLVVGGVGYRMRGFLPGVHVGLPSRRLTVAVSFDAPLDLAIGGDPRGLAQRYQATASGLHGGPVYIHHDGVQFGVHLELTARGARALFGRPAAELASTAVELDAVFGPAGELVDRLRSASDWSSRFSVIEQYLTKVKRDDPPVRPELVHAWRRLAASSGSASIGALAGEVGWSRRHLTKQFSAEVGLGPKVVARIMRFEGAVARLKRGSCPSLAALAAECGYADQAHLTREWVEFVGASPTAWLAAERFPFVQDELSQSESW